MPYQAIRPQSEGYNLWTPQYAASVARQTGNPGADVLNQLVLAMRSRGEQGTYADAIAAANANQLQGSTMEAQADLAKTYLQQIPNMAKESVLQGVTVAQPYVTVDPAIAAQVGAVNLNRTVAAAQGERAGAVADLAGAGMAPPMEDVGVLMTSPLDETPIPIQPDLRPEDIADMERAKAAMLSAQASMVSANRPRGGGGDGDGGGAPVKMDYTLPAFDGLPPTIKLSGKNPAAVMAAAAAARGTPQQQVASGTENRRPPRYIKDPETGRRVRNPNYGR